MKNQAAEAHIRGASREVTSLFARLDAMFQLESLEEAASVLNLACEAKGLPGVYSAKALLNLAMNAQVRLTVHLPADFIVHRKNDSAPFADTPRRPVFPANSDFLCIKPETAYEIYQSQGGTVALRRSANIKPDGTADNFVAARPYVNISLADLRVGQDEIFRLIRELPNATTDHASDLASNSAPPARENFDESRASRTVAEAQHAAPADAEACDEAGTPSDTATSYAAALLPDTDAEREQNDSRAPPVSEYPAELRAAALPEHHKDEYFDPEDAGLKKRERQIRRIEWLAKKLGFSPTSIPDGGKTLLSKECRGKWPELFGVGEDPFNAAWKEAGDRLRMKNHDRYLPE